ncbi:MAG: insulinase family protein, partial [Erysipelotrichaceae bacterium]|nr:insulinase family protein [Erysipelotrichaceae bacterium]
MSILIDVLAGSQEAPLRQALVKSGLTEDFELYVDDGMQQSALFMVYRNTEKENVGKLNEILQNTLEEIRKTGLNYKMIEGTLNFMEFRAKMKESFAPRGILNAITVMDSWLYGGDPLQNLKINSLYKQLREGLQNGLFEQLFERLLDDSHRQTVILTPSVTIQQEKEEQLHDALQQLKSSWDETTVQSVMEMNRKLRAVQQREDTPEELAAMPVLKLEDIDTTVEPLPLREDCIDGVTVLWSEQDTEGIIHCELMFDISDATEEDLLKLSFAPGLWGELATEHYSAYDLQAEVRSVLGAFGIGKEVNVHTHEDSYKPTFTVFFSCLEEKREQAWELVKEIIFRTKWEDTEVVHNMLRQEKYNDEQGLISSGHSYAMRRVGACLTPWYATQEYLSGYESMKWLRHVEETFDENGKDVLADWKETTLKFLTRNRLILGYIGTENKEFAGELIHSFEEKEPGAPAVIRLLDNHKEGIEIASGISYAVMGGILPESVTEKEGQLRVLSKILTLYYLWNEIRVQGGAYGTGFAGRARGFASFYSYRDPNCSNSLNVYRKAAEYIRNLDLSEEELTKTIIGTMSDLDPVISVRQKGRSAFANRMAGFTQQDREQLRKQVLSTTLDDIHGFADALEELAA